MFTCFKLTLSMTCYKNSFYLNCLIFVSTEEVESEDQMEVEEFNLNYMNTFLSIKSFLFKITFKLSNTLIKLSLNFSFQLTIHMNTIEPKIFFLQCDEPRKYIHF